jgi:hypothetical protein
MSGSLAAPLRAAFSMSIALALAATLLATAPASAASPTACRVRNLDTGVTSTSLQQAVNRAANGHRLRVRGTCRGSTVIRKSLRIIGLLGFPSRVGLVGTGKGRVVTIGRNATVRIEGLRIGRGNAPAGGGILNRGTLSLRDVRVRGNAAQSFGGGVVNVGTLTLHGSTIRSNTASYCAGAWNEGTFVLNTTSSIRLNTTPDQDVDPLGGGGWGGGVCNHGTLTLNGSSSIRWNRAFFAGGGVVNMGAVTLNGYSSIRGNSLPPDTGVLVGPSLGGGIWNGDLATSLAMRDASSITGNSAGVGGGVWSHDASVLDGVVCAPDVGANVHGNSPDQCAVEP